MKIPEGDIMMVYVNKKMLTIRLAHIDCPDIGQPFEKQATQFTHSLAYKKKVTVEIESYAGEQYLIGRVFIENKDVSMTLIEAGLAWYTKMHGADRYISKAFRKAKKKKIGIWSQDKPIPPWIYRQEKEKNKQRSETD
ncbi:MAG: thermonuclease family protein [Candidatus Aminicenantes bacterium]|nr:thermonuclease family protein [Candidatus Aminicenantes bacterium]